MYYIVRISLSLQFLAKLQYLQYRRHIPHMYIYIYYDEVEGRKKTLDLYLVFSSTVLYTYNTVIYSKVLYILKILSKSSK